MRIAIEWPEDCDSDGNVKLEQDLSNRIQQTIKAEQALLDCNANFEDNYQNADKYSWHDHLRQERYDRIRESAGDTRCHIEKGIKLHR
jgi:hypothetical protein